MKKKQQTKPKVKRGNAIAAVEKADEDGWNRLLKLRERLRKAAPHNEATERLEKLGEEIGKGWQSKKARWKFFRR